VILRGLLIMIVASLPMLSYGQNTDHEIDIESFAEDLFQIQDDDIDYEDLYESLLMQYTNPINLNRASKEELTSLYQIDNSQAEALLEYLGKNGSLISIYELQAIPGFDSNTIRKLMPFVTVEERPSDTRPLLVRILSEENNYLLTRTERTFEKRKGFDIIDTLNRQGFLGGRAKNY